MALLRERYIEARISTGEILKRDRAMFISFSPNVVKKAENRLTKQFWILDERILD